MLESIDKDKLMNTDMSRGQVVVQTDEGKSWRQRTPGLVQAKVETGRR